MSGAPWPVGLSASEGVANARTGRWVSLIVVVAAAWIVAGLGLANALEVSALAQAEQEWIAAGAFVMSVEPASDGTDAHIDVASCERLSRVDGISASFAVSATSLTIESANAPGTPTTLTEVSPGIYPFLRANEPLGVGVVATRTTAGPTGLANREGSAFTLSDTAGTTHHLDATTVLVEGTDLGPSLTGSFLLPTLLTGYADSCYLRTDAAHAKAVAIYVGQALAAPNGSPAVVRRMLSENTFGLNFASAYSTRTLQWGWAGGALVLTILWALVQRARRARRAVYQTFGTHPQARVIMQVTEWMLLSVLGATWGWGIGLSLAIALGCDSRIALTQITLQALAMWQFATIGVVAIAIIPVGTLLDALKDRS